jgi:hypothetical protein
VSFFLGSISQHVNLSKLESALSANTTYIRELDHSGSAGTRKYLCVLIENMVNMKKFSQRDAMLLLHATSSAIIKLTDETMWHLEVSADIAASSAATDGQSALPDEGKYQMMQDRIDTVSHEYDQYKEEKFLELYQQSKTNGELQMKVDEQASALLTLEDRIKQLEVELEAATTAAATPPKPQALEVDRYDCMHD